MNEYDRHQERVKADKVRLSERNAESAADGIRNLNTRVSDLGAVVKAMADQINNQAQHLAALELLLQNQNVRMVGHGPTE